MTRRQIALLSAQAIELGQSPHLPTDTLATSTELPLLPVLGLVLEPLEYPRELAVQFSFVPCSVVEQGAQATVHSTDHVTA